MTDAPARTALTLRALQPADCDRLLTWIDSSDALWQWSGARSFTWPLDRGQLLHDLAAHAGSSVELLAGIDEDGQMVAHVLVDAQHHHGLGFIGRVAVAPEQRGRGVGAALMRATIRHGFEELGLHRLQLTVYTFNVAAIATYRSVGFVVEGLARASTRGSTGRWDGLTMSLLEPDYRHPPTFGAGIRIAGPRDAAAIATLLTQLGYPHDCDQTAARLLSWAAEPAGEVLVAEAEGGGMSAGAEARTGAGDGIPVGFAAVHRVPYFERPGAFARVVALSVDAAQRRAGVGRRLMAAVEGWAAARGCVEVEVTSLRSREPAHRFYAALGYEDRCAESGRLRRALPDGPGA
jgi:RimJ/RimL family protein N-acetyltransferase